jgi:hypothetical protein
MAMETIPVAITIAKYAGDRFLIICFFATTITCDSTATARGVRENCLWL